MTIFDKKNKRPKFCHYPSHSTMAQSRAINEITKKFRLRNFESAKNALQPTIILKENVKMWVPVLCRRLESGLKWRRLLLQIFFAFCVFGWKSVGAKCRRLNRSLGQHIRAEFFKGQNWEDKITAKVSKRVV